MSYSVIAIYVALQVLYLSVGVGQIVLVASKFREHMARKLELTRKSSNSKTFSLGSIQDKFVAFNGFALLSCCVLAAFRALAYIMSYTRVLPCALIAHAGGSTFQVFKTLMYLVFIFRAEAIYRDTLYAYSTRLLTVAAVMLVLFNAVVVVLFNVFVTTYEKEDAGALCVCGAKAPMIVLLPSIAQDIFVNLWFLRLFTRPLRLLTESSMKPPSPIPAPLPLGSGRSDERGSSKHSSDQVSDIGAVDMVRVSTKSRSAERRARASDEMKDLRKVAVKCAVVTWVAVISTFINLLLIGSMGFMEFQVLDYLINNTCMIFMTNWCDRHFPKLCYVPLSAARCMPCLCGDIPEF